MILFQNKSTPVHPLNTSEQRLRSHSREQPTGRPYSLFYQTGEEAAEAKSCDESPGGKPYLCCLQYGILKLPVSLPQSRALGDVQPHRREGSLEYGAHLLDSSFLPNATDGILGIFQPNLRTCTKVTRNR